MPGKKRATPMDLHIGQRISQIRMLRGHAQKDLAQALSISTAQVQKYEDGSSSIPAVRLYAISGLYAVRIHKFFDGFEEEGE